MRIGIDARELCGRPTGVGRYLRGLLTAWSKSDRARQHEFVLYATEMPPLTLDAHRFPTHLVGGRPDTFWEQVRLPSAVARDHLDVLFSPAYTSPLYRRVPIVVTIHDVSFSAHPEWFSVREGVRRRWLTARSAAQARMVITDSQFSRREIVERLGVAEGKVHVIFPGVLPPPQSGEQGARMSVLYVGSIFNRRHVPLLIRSFGALARAHPEPTLDLVGDNRTHPYENIQEFLAREQLDSRARWREYVSETELGGLYGQARAFVFLSEYEGFGLTPLEALAARVPPVVLDTEVARETCGDAALYVSLDAAAVTRALELVLFDQPTRTRLLTAASQVLARYSWSRAADETLTVLEQHR